MNASEISEIKDGDSIIINGIDTVFQGGKFYSSDMELRSRSEWNGGNERVIFADYHTNSHLWNQMSAVKISELVQDAKRATYGLKTLFTVERGGKMTLAEKARIGKQNEDIYGNS